jgi:hypothetical protein
VHDYVWPENLVKRVKVTGVTCSNESMEKRVDH